MNHRNEQLIRLLRFLKKGNDFTVKLYIYTITKFVLLYEAEKMSSLRSDH